VDAPLTIEQLTTEVRDIALQVHSAQERQEDREFVTATIAAVDRLSQRFKQLLASLSSAEQLKVERALGRRVADIRRLASLLPRVAGATASSTPDRQVTGASTVGERRITGVSWTHDRSAPTQGIRVGGEVEAWCGKCGDVKTHNVVAMVGDEPKQVLCQSCGSRHAYRTSAARRKTGEPTATETNSRRTSAGDPEAKKRAEALRALNAEIAAAEVVRPFDPKQRYRAGEIIDHPEYGRGRIENVLRSSLLVRFPAAGLKPLSLW
jgi:hypothetical protein